MLQTVRFEKKYVVEKGGSRNCPEIRKRKRVTKRRMTPSFLDVIFGQPSTKKTENRYTRESF